MHLKNIDFDIDIEIFGTFDFDIGIDIEKNGVNIETLSSEREARASQTEFFIDSFFFLEFWHCFLEFWVLPHYFGYDLLEISTFEQKLIKNE